MQEREGQIERKRERGGTSPSVMKDGGRVAGRNRARLLPLHRGPGIPRQVGAFSAFSLEGGDLHVELRGVISHIRSEGWAERPTVPGLASLHVHPPPHMGRP